MKIHPPENQAPLADNKRIMRRFLWRLLRPHSKWLGLALFLNCLSGVAISAQTLAPKYLVDDILAAPGLDFTQKIHRLALFSLAFLGVTVIWRMLFWHVGFRIFTRIRESILREVRSTFFRHINYLCLRFHVKHQSGELFSYLFGSPLTQVQQYFHQFSAMGPHSVFIILGILVGVARWDWVLALVLTLTTGISVLAMESMRNRIKLLHKDYQDQESSISGRVADLLRGSRHIKLYAIEDQVINQFDAAAATIGSEGVRRDVKGHELWMRQETVGYAGFVFLCVAGAWRYFSGHVTSGELIVCLTTFYSLQGLFNNLLQIMNLQGGAEASLERIAAVLDTLSTTPEPTPENKVVPQRNAPIHVESVSFSYTGTPVIEKLNLTIPYGQNVALVGPSGSGKSTLTQLLLRLYDPQEGRILVGDADLRLCSGRDIRRLFGIVPQDPYFFQATLLENIQLVKPGASREDVRQALVQANAWEFVEQMPLGLDTLVGEQGATLSGGQRQRLAIARALLQNPPYLIFDEATSALDSVSEQKIQDVLVKILKGRTSLFIAHRLATVRRCDRVLVMQNGKLIQDGRFETLAVEPGLFRDMLAQNHFATPA